METIVIDAKENKAAGTEQGAGIIRSGGLVAFPTETVYGLGANGLDGDAVKRIFEAKGRPGDNPLILHIADKKDVKMLWESVPEAATVLMDTFWPGPLTMIAKRSGIVPNEVTAGLDTVAIRMPSNETAAELIRRSGVPIAAPSANLSGKPSPTTARHVLDDMNGRIPLILDGGSCDFGVESTVISLTGETPVILRPGAVTKEMLEAVLGKVGLSSAVLNPLGSGEVAASPGMKYKHYAPEAEVIVVTGEPEQAAARILAEYHKAKEEKKRVKILATEETKGFYPESDCAILGTRGNPITLCRNLFSMLRDLDSSADLILAEGISTEDAGLAYMNRVLRSAGFHVIRT